MLRAAALSWGPAIRFLLRKKPCLNLTLLNDTQCTTVAAGVIVDGADAESAGEGRVQ